MIISSNGKFFEDPLHFELSGFDTTLKSKTEAPLSTYEYLKEQERDMEFQQDFLGDMGGLPNPTPQDISLSTKTPITKAPEGPSGGITKALEGATDTVPEPYKTWPERMVHSLIDAFKLPGDVYQGNEPDGVPLSRATELAGALIFGPAPIARKVVDGTLGSFAGVGARTADKSSLSVAKEAAEIGLNQDQIYHATGWFRLSDGKWRHELSTDNWNIKSISDLKDGKYKLSDILNAETLYEAYPQFKDTNLWIDRSSKFQGGRANNGDLIINPNKILAKDPKDLKETLVHEIQHNIQAVEGFQLGTTPGKMQINVTQGLQDKIREAKEAGKDASKYESLLADAMAQHLDTLLKGRGESIFKFLYRGQRGEREAELAAIRSGWEDALREYESPMQTLRRVESVKRLPKEYNIPETLKSK